MGRGWGGGLSSHAAWLDRWLGVLVGGVLLESYDRCFDFCARLETDRVASVLYTFSDPW